MSRSGEASDGSRRRRPNWGDLGPRLISAIVLVPLTALALADVLYEAGLPAEMLSVVTGKLAANGKLGPVARLMPTTAATTLRKDREPALVMDGPFAETKEQLLGFYIVDCDNLEEALAIAQDLGRANPGGAYEIRPVAAFMPAPKPGDAA